MIIIIALCIVIIALLLLTLQNEKKLITQIIAWLDSQTLKNKAVWENWKRYENALNVYMTVCQIIKIKFPDFEPSVLFYFMESSNRKILYRLENGVDWIVIANNLQAEYRKNGINIRAVAHNGLLTVTFL